MAPKLKACPDCGHFTCTFKDCGCTNCKQPSQVENV